MRLDFAGLKVRAAVVVAIAGVVLGQALDTTHVHAQAARPVAPDTTDPLARAMSAEDRRDVKTAAIAYRQVLQRALSAAVNDGDQASMAMLGLERVWTEAGMQDSILPVVERVLLVRRSDPIARGIQLRLYLGRGNDDMARMAFNDWRRAVPTESGPYREYARQLLQSGRAKSADTILADAQRSLGSTRELSGEVAQLNISLERWVPAAVAFKAALVDQPWLDHSAEYALQRTPAALRDSVRNVLLSTPVTLGARRVMSEIELAWGEPRRAWAALSALKADDSTTAAWKSFAEFTEASGVWGVARDAWTAVMEKTGELSSVERAANAAIKANDPQGALALIARGSSNRSGAQVTKALIGVEVAALSELGRAADAQKRIDESKQYIDDGMRAELLKPLVGAWLRTGNLDQARAAAANADLSDDDETAGWLALYAGDLVTARRRLVRVDSRRGTQIAALAVLSRTRATTSPELGAAFLTVARRDTTLAVTQFTALAGTMLDAAPALIAFAARLEEGRSSPAATARAIVLWKRIRTEFPKSAEAPEAQLNWAQLLAKSGDYKGAVEQMEALLIDFPDSALAPQARRELPVLRAKIPPTGI